VIEQGFGLINSLHITAIDCFFKEVKNSYEENKKSEKESADSDVTDD
jgi:hypothetical protein